VKSRGIQSIEVGGRPLQALARVGEPMMLRDLARESASRDQCLRRTRVRSRRRRRPVRNGHGSGAIVRRTLDQRYRKGAARLHQRYLEAAGIFGISQEIAFAR
jgi:hypothetical protein